jgi:hypothetical protein
MVNSGPGPGHWTCQTGFRATRVTAPGRPGGGSPTGRAAQRVTRMERVEVGDVRI